MTFFTFNDVWEKLKQEYKTLVVAVASGIVFGYDALVANNIDYLPLVPDGYQRYAAFAVPVLMLLLRKYRP